MGSAPKSRRRDAHSRCTGRAVRMGRAAGRHGRHRGGRRSAAAARCDSIRRTKLALKGPLTTPGRRRLPLGQRPAARGIRALRQRSPGAHPGARRSLTRTSTSSSCARTSRACTSPSSTTSRSATIRMRWRSPRASTPVPRSQRIVRFAFEYALSHGRKKVTLVHKANMLKALTGLFLRGRPRDRQGLRGPDRDGRSHRRRLRDAARA